MVHSVQSGGNATKSFLKAPKIQSSQATPSGRNTSSKPSPVIQIGGPRSSHPINRELTGKSGSLRWLHPRNTRGHCILFGNFCITIRAPCHFSQTIRFRTRQLITFGRDSIVINSRPSARKRGGNANQLANGYLHSRRTILNFIVCSKQWIGWIETATVTNFVSPNRIHVEACPGCQRKFSGAD